MQEFVTAARDEFEENEEGKLVFLHDGREVVFYEPGAGQMAVMTTLSTNTKDLQAARMIISFFFSVMDEETHDYFQDRLMDRRDPFELDSEGGVIDIFEYIMEQWSGKGTKQPSDYQQSHKATGRSSTGNSRAKGSTSSNSRSRASSTSSKRGQ